jgi:ankyrin repeat protein
MIISPFLSHLFHPPISRLATMLLITLSMSSFVFCGLIHDASWDGDIQKVTTLLKENHILVFSKDKYGYTPLHWAALAGHNDVAEFLLANGADVNATSNNGHVPWYEGKVNGHNAVTILDNNYGFAPLHLAALNGHKDVVELLVAKGANVNANNGGTPLHRAAGHKEVMEFLLAHGADVNAKANNGETPLHYAARRGEGNLAELLMAHGADINVKSNKGHTPLYVAAREGHKDVVELLRQHGGHE